MCNISTQIYLPLTFHIFGMDHRLLLNFLLNDDLTSRNSCLFWCILISTRGISRYYLKPTDKYNFSIFTYQAHLTFFCGLRLWALWVLDCFMLLTWLCAVHLSPAVFLWKTEIEMEKKGVAASLDWALLSDKDNAKGKNKALVCFWKGSGP